MVINIIQEEADNGCEFDNLDDCLRDTAGADSHTDGLYNFGGIVTDIIIGDAHDAQIQRLQHMDNCFY